MLVVCGEVRLEVREMECGLARVPVRDPEVGVANGHGLAHISGSVPSGLRLDQTGL